MPIVKRRSACRCSSRRRARPTGEVRDDSAQRHRRRCRRSSTCSTPTSTGSSTGTRCSTAATPTIEPRVSHRRRRGARHRSTTAARNSRTATTGSASPRSATTATSSAREVADLAVGDAERVHRRRSTRRRSSPTCRPTTGRCRSPSPAACARPRPSRRSCVVAVNGRVAGVIGGYVPDGDRLGVHRLPRRRLPRPGSNDVASTRSAADGDDVTLHPVAASRP